MYKRIDFRGQILVDELITMKLKKNIFLLLYIVKTLNTVHAALSECTLLCR